MAAAEEANLRAPPGMGEQRHKHRELKEQEARSPACSSALPAALPAALPTPPAGIGSVPAARAARRMARAREPVFVRIPILTRFGAARGCSLAHARDPKPPVARSQPVPRWPQVLPVCNLEPLHASSGRRSRRSPRARTAILRLRHGKGHRHPPRRCLSIFLPAPRGCRKARGGSVPTQRHDFQQHLRADVPAPSAAGPPHPATKGSQANLTPPKPQPGHGWQMKTPKILLHHSLPHLVPDRSPPRAQNTPREVFLADVQSRS